MGRGAASAYVPHAVGLAAVSVFICHERVHVEEKVLDLVKGLDYCFVMHLNT